MRVHLAALHRHQTGLRAVVTLNRPEPGADGRIEDAGIDRGWGVVCCGTDGNLALIEVFDRPQSRFGRQDEQPDLLLRRAEPVELANIELNARIVEVVEPGKPGIAR